MVSIMKKIKIFLASSITEFAEERNALELFIRNVSDEFEEKYDTKIIPLRCENIDPCMSKVRKQDEYNQLIKDSEMCFFIFFTHAGKYTQEEFEIAYEQFKNSENHKPKVYIYFKNLPKDIKIEQSVKDFMEKVDKTYHHYYGTFDHIDTIKLRILLNLKLQEMNFVKIEINDYKCIVDGKETLNLENVSEFMNSDELKKLKIEFVEVEERYYQMKAIYAKGDFDDTFHMEYSQLAAKRQKLLDSIENLQKSIFDMSLRLSYDEVYGNITPRMKEAYRLLELGDSKGCIEVLDEEELKEDYLKLKERRKERRLQEDKLSASCFIRENKLAIDVLMTMYSYKDRINEIDRRYNIVVPEIEEYLVELDTLFDYAKYLYNQNNYNRGIEIIEKLCLYWDDSIPKTSKYNKADIYNLAASFYMQNKNYEKAENLFKSSIEIYEKFIRLASSESEMWGYKSFLALTLNNFATLYSFKEDYEAARKYFRLSIKDYETLIKMNFEAFVPTLATLYNNFANILRETKHYEDAEKIYNKSLEIYEKLSKENFQEYISDLALIYSNKAILFGKSNRQIEAEEMFIKSIKMYEELSISNPHRYISKLANCYNNYSVLYSHMGQNEKVAQIILQSIKIYEKSIKCEPQRYGQIYINQLQRLATHYMISNQYNEAENLYIKIIDFCQQLIRINKKEYEREIVKAYLFLAHLYFNTNRDNLAEEIIFKAYPIAQKYQAEDEICKEICENIED